MTAIIVINVSFCYGTISYSMSAFKMVSMHSEWWHIPNSAGNEGKGIYDNRLSTSARAEK